MSRIVGDSLVGGPETARAPEYVTVRLTRGQAEVLSAAAENVRDVIADVEESTQVDRDFLAATIAALRAQIGGAP